MSMRDPRRMVVEVKGSAGVLIANERGDLFFLTTILGNIHTSPMSQFTVALRCSVAMMRINTKYGG